MWDSAAEANRWWLQAENDLAFARVALRERFFAQACFVAQQPAEKAVKAIAYGLGERVVLGHSISSRPVRCEVASPCLPSWRAILPIWAVFRGVPACNLLILNDRDSAERDVVP